MLTGSGLAIFFDNEGKEGIALELKSEASTHGIADTTDAIFEFFLSRVRSNLHIVFSTSPSRALFHQRCRTYPSLINNSTIDWYSKWPFEALVTVADKYLSKESFLSEVAKSVTKILAYTHGEH